MMAYFSLFFLCLMAVPMLSNAQGNVLARPDCANQPVLPDYGYECTRRFGGQCVKFGCRDCPVQRWGLCGPFFNYVCCRTFPLRPARCSMVGDPYVTTFDGYWFPMQIPGWYYASRHCGGFWEARAFFNYPTTTFPGVTSWTVFHTLEFQYGGGPTLVVNKFRNIAYNGFAVIPNFAVFFYGGFFIVINRLPGPNDPIYITTSFGVSIQVIPLPRPALYITVTPVWYGNTCGWCGNFNGISGDDSANIKTSGVVTGRKREIEAEEQEAIQRQEREDGPNCSLEEPDAAGLEYCQAQLDLDSGNCSDVDTTSFLSFCATDYCLGAETSVEQAMEFADYSLSAFKHDCYPPKQAVCEMCGFREITTFDGVKYSYLGSECSYNFAKDCSDDELWSITVYLKNQLLGGQEELLLSRVKITYDDQTVMFMRSGKIVKVNGEVEPNEYESPDSEFIITYDENLVEFKSPSLVIAYNFKQMLRVQAEGNNYGNTCGMCGNFNEDESDDPTSADADDFQLSDDCEEGVLDTPCDSLGEHSEANTICADALQSVPCFDLDVADFIPRCINEFCAGGYKLLCQHLLGYCDKCFYLSRDEAIYEHVPEACKKCLPRKGMNSPVPPTPISKCKKKGGKCLNSECEKCDPDFVEGMCDGAGKKRKCCLNPRGS